MGVGFAGKLPKTNGLSVIEGVLVERPKDRHIVIGVIDTSKITVDQDTDAAQATVRFRRIEVIQGDDVHMQHAAALMAAASDRRNGVDPLPFDMYVSEEILEEAVRVAVAEEQAVEREKTDPKQDGPQTEPQTEPPADKPKGDGKPKRGPKPGPEFKAPGEGPDDGTGPEGTGPGNAG